MKTSDQGKDLKVEIPYGPKFSALFFKSERVNFTHLEWSWRPLLNLLEELNSILKKSDLGKDLKVKIPYGPKSSALVSKYEQCSYLESKALDSRPYIMYLHF